MSQARQEAIDTIRQEEAAAVAAFQSWASGHAGEYIGTTDYRPDEDPDQKPEVVLIPAKPDLQKARLFGEMGMGPSGYNRFIDDLHTSGALETVLANADEGLSTLIATVHLQNILDTPLTHNGLFVAANDESFANKNVIVSNTMVKFLSLGSIAVPKVISISGVNVLGTPAEGARQHGVPKGTVRSLNRLASPVISGLLNEGVAFHRALTDTRAQEVTLESGEKIRVIPPVSITPNRRIGTAVGVAMNVELGQGEARVLEPRNIDSADDINQLMRELAEASSEIFDQRVVYAPALEANNSSR